MTSIRTLIVAAVALPMVAAQAQQAAPSSDPITAAFRNRTTTLRRNIAQALDSIPESKYTYKPTEKQLTVGYIAQHVTSDNYLFCNAFGVKKAALTDEDTKTSDDEKAAWPKAKLMEKLHASITFCDDATNQLTDANIGEMLTMAGRNGQSRQVSRANYVIGHAIDLADHYSQLANYMRLNGILPPTALPRPGRGGDR